jgi:hypothetical protein
VNILRHTSGDLFHGVNARENVSSALYRSNPGDTKKL